MPVPIQGSKVGSDNQKAKFLTTFGRPKTGIFREFQSVPGRAPLATDHAAWGADTVIPWGADTLWQKVELHLRRSSVFLATR